MFNLSKNFYHPNSYFTYLLVGGNHQHWALGFQKNFLLKGKERILKKNNSSSLKILNHW